jgi:UDP-glucose 4-epimerase
MDVLILGAGGMLGRKLAQAIAAGGLGGATPPAMRLVDRILPPMPATEASADVLALDLAAAGAMDRVLAGNPALIFHLAAIVSAEAEADFELGYSVNLDTTRALFEAIRARPGYAPRVVFASSTAVFGAPFPDTIPDDFQATPRSSYGTQKAIGELLLNDYSRRGVLDGVALRLPTICVRPGAPNRAASSFFSGILREPLAGQPATLPVPDSLRHWFASPRAAVGFFLRAATMDTAPLGFRRALNMPGLSATVGEQIEALRRVAGQAAVDLIRREPDPVIAAIVETWPQRFDTARAASMGFVAETSFDQILRIYLDEDAPQLPVALT